MLSAKSRLLSLINRNFYIAFTDVWYHDNIGIGIGIGIKYLIPIITKLIIIRNYYEKNDTLFTID